MKKTIFLVLAMATLIFTQCKKENETCKNNNAALCNLADLSDEYNPVCGCDGKTYQNGGHAVCIGQVSEYKQGKCK